MAEIIRMPRMSDTMEEGNIVGWLKNVGDTVEPGDVLAEVETDKATMELESYFEGTLLHIGVKEGPVPVNGVLAVIGEKGEDYKEILAAAEAESPAEAPPAPSHTMSHEMAATIDMAVADHSNASSANAPSTSPPMDSDQRIKASPLAKSIAKEKGLDLSTIKGSGENGRIVKKDLENISTPSMMTAGQASPSPIQNLQPDVQYGANPVTQIRKVIAKKLSESKFTAPHFYLTMEVNMDKAKAARKEINESGDIRISFNDIVVKATAAALRKHPNINASWMGDHIEIHRDIHIGVAVAIPDGLVVPVVRNADLKGFEQINADVKDLATKARDRKLSLQEMQGNTFTISNLGMFGIEEFTAIINPPDACILAVGGIIQKPIVKNGEIVVGNMMKLTLSCDHRIVDGATGSQFLLTLKNMLENPVRMLV